MEEYKKRDCCAICKNTELQTIVNLGKVPLAGNFPKESELDNVKSYELSLQFCPACSLVQTDSIIDSDTLFKDYRYMSSIGLSNHFREVAELYKSRYVLTDKHKILEIGSNDGVLLEPLTKLGLNAVGVEPASNIAKVAIERGCNTIVDYFHGGTARKYFEKETIDLVIANNCFAHIDDIHSIVEGVKYVLKKDAYFVIEVHYLKKLIDELQYDFIYHEHLYYYSLTAIVNLFSQFGMSVVEFEEIDIHSGSIRVTIQNSENKISEQVSSRLELEKIDGLTDYDYFLNFKQRIESHIQKLTSQIESLKQQGYTIAGYGASGRANMLLNMCGLTATQIDYIVDESPERINRYIPGVNIPVVPLEYFQNHIPDYVFILAWNYADMIINKLQTLGYSNLKYITPFTK